MPLESIRDSGTLAIVAAAKFPLDDVASSSLGTSYDESFISIDGSSPRFNIGGVTINGDGRIVIPKPGLYHIETALFLVDPSPSNSGGRRTIYSRTRVQRAGAIISGTESLATTYARGVDDADEFSIEHNNWELLRAGDILIADIKAENSARNYRLNGSMSFISLVGLATAA